MRQISVIVADAVPLMVDALARVLSYEGDLTVFSDRPTTGLEVVEAVLSLRPDVALIDFWLPDMEGAAATRLIISRQPERKVLIMSWFHGTREMEAALDAGAAGFLPKSLNVARLADAIRRADAGESPVYLEELEEMFRRLSRRTDQVSEIWRKLEALSKRELELLALLSLNLSPKEAARRLSISPQTVKVHIRNMLEKTGAHSYIDVVNMGRACGLIRT